MKVTRNIVEKQFPRRDFGTVDAIKYETVLTNRINTSYNM